MRSGRISPPVCGGVDDNNKSFSEVRLDVWMCCFECVLLELWLAVSRINPLFHYLFKHSGCKNLNQTVNRSSVFFRNPLLNLVLHQPSGRKRLSHWLTGRHQRTFMCLEWDYGWFNNQISLFWVGDRWGNEADAECASVTLLSVIIGLLFSQLHEGLMEDKWPEIGNRACWLCSSRDY